MPQLISNYYKDQCTLMHQQHADWGFHAPQKNSIVRANLAMYHQCWLHWGKGTVLDYGCGKGWLAANMPIPVAEYDPGIPGKDTIPEPADFVLCLDVLEHIEPDYLDTVLEDLQRVVLRYGIFTIACKPASAILPDGRNAHLIIQNTNWWMQKLLNHFDIHQMYREQRKMIVVLQNLSNGTY